MSQNPKTLYFISLCDDDVGEVEGMFDADGTILGTWACNDGQWRGEYFDGFLMKLGFEVLMWDAMTDEWREGLEDKLKARWQ